MTVSEGSLFFSKASAHTWKSRGKVSLGGVPERDFNTQGTISGLDHLRRETVFPQFRSLVVLDGDKGWHKGGDTFRELTGDELANAKRLVYLDVIPITLLLYPYAFAIRSPLHVIA